MSDIDIEELRRMYDNRLAPDATYSGRVGALFDAIPKLLDRIEALERDDANSTAECVRLLCAYCKLRESVRLLKGIVPEVLPELVAIVEQVGSWKCACVVLRPDDGGCISCGARRAIAKLRGEEIDDA